MLFGSRDHKEPSGGVELLPVRLLEAGLRMEDAYYRLIDCGDVFSDRWAVGDVPCSLCDDSETTEL